MNHPNVPPRRMLAPAYSAIKPMIKSMMPQKTRAWMIGTVSRLLGTQATRANSDIASKTWKPPTTNIMIAANVIKPGRPVAGVWTAGLLRVSSRPDGPANRSSLLLSTLSPYFCLLYLLPLRLSVHRPTDTGANLTNRAASFPAHAREFPLADDHRRLSPRGSRARTHAERHHDGGNATR